MVVEYIRYTVDDARAAAFAEAYRQAAVALDASEHCERYEVSRCSEDPTRHIVRIEWDSEEGHLTGFRRSAEFAGFLEAVRPFVHDIEEMRHYHVTLSSGYTASAPGRVSPLS
jgi:quinol monooxygenase YgiN